LQRLEQQPCRQSCLPDARGPNENDIFGLGHEVQLGEGADLPLRHAGLALERERFDRPRLRHGRLFDPPCHRALLLMVPLCPEQPSEQLLVR
jgi:hypothetical protein